MRGRLEPRELLLTPLSGSRVVGYRVLIEILAAYWMNRRVLVDFGRLASCTFHPRDGGDAVTITASSIQLLVEEPCVEGRRAGGSDDEPRAFPEEVASLLADQAQIHAEARDVRRYRWAEYHLHGDEEIAMEGVVDPGVSDPDAPRSPAEPGTPADASSLDAAGPRLVGVGDRPLWVTTVPHDDLFAALVEPDEHWLRAVPRQPLGDRTTD